jgi:hypothetical protein
MRDQDGAAGSLLSSERPRCFFYEGLQMLDAEWSAEETELLREAGEYFEMNHNPLVGIVQVLDQTLAHNVQAVLRSLGIGDDIDTASAVIDLLISMQEKGLECVKNDNVLEALGYLVVQRRLMESMLDAQ